MDFFNNLPCDIKRVIYDVYDDTYKQYYSSVQFKNDLTTTWVNKREKLLYECIKQCHFSESYSHLNVKFVLVHPYIIKYSLIIPKDILLKGTVSYYKRGFINFGKDLIIRGIIIDDECYQEINNAIHINNNLWYNYYTKEEVINFNKYTYLYTNGYCYNFNKYPYPIKCHVWSEN